MSEVVLTPDPTLVAQLQTDLEDLTSAQVIRWRPEDPTGFNVLDVRPRNERTAPIVFPMSFDYRIDSLMKARLRVLAAVVGARVIGVETPGVTMDAVAPVRTTRTSVPWTVMWSTLCGDFRKLAEMQVQAITQALRLNLGEVQLVGESLGAQAVSAMASFVAVRSLDLIEPANAERRPLQELPALGRALTTLEHERRRDMIALSRRRGWPDILAFEDSSPENTALDHDFKRFSNQGRWAVVSAVGLHRPLQKTLVRVPLSVPITMWRARESTVCTAAAFETLRVELNARGHQVEIVTMSTPDGGAGHHVLTGLSEMTAFASALATRHLT